MKKRLLSVLLCVTVAAALVIGCGSKSGDSEGTTKASDDGKKTYKFGFTEMSAGSFFDACYEGAAGVIEANGDTIVHVEGKADSTYQLGVIEDFIAQGCDLVFYNPSDASASAAAVKALNDAGIPIVNFDSAVSDLSKVDCFVVSDSYSCGQIAGEELVKNHPEGGKVAVLDFPASAAAADRAKGFIDTVTENGFEVVAQMDAGAKPEKGLTVMEDLIQAHSDLVAVFCINDECAQGAYSAITAAGEKIEIYSVNAGPEAKAAMTSDGVDGIWKCSAAQSPIGIGQKSAEVAYKILNGEEVEKEVQIASFAVTPENIEEYNDSDWQ
ncbi:substrate-binding domain-containing protein [Faecalicatena contorta]|uniref:Ribose transport system substrate-binding protein n=1 Tax=Faecalicatena contorta TaxID=39482 RepID=A0A316A3L7_9FIRM|nr:substrate-binding domain-containing protein [Faecalicatena contorta]PWJ52099.1 ribose transport system substrate-binding protein [Faecalicatena contorta]SUQ12377.1 ribose transport system substrate-binding protein [Faecalicatena contorta]